MSENTVKALVRERPSQSSPRESKKVVATAGAADFTRMVSRPYCDKLIESWTGYVDTQEVKASRGD